MALKTSDVVAARAMGRTLHSHMGICQDFFFTISVQQNSALSSAGFSLCAFVLVQLTNQNHAR